MLMTNRQRELFKTKVLNFVYFSGKLVTVADAKKKLKRSFGFTQKILEELYKEKAIKKKKLADRTFYYYGKRGTFS